MGEALGVGGTPLYVDCKQSLFSSKTVGKTQNKHGSMTVIVTALLQVAQVSEDD